mmetsp:Transcript_6889/g.10165  ORF Transcript_6889/g.10165 Transcript_6889/m.10165 type:complete len:241 (+) Transcript_6889:504-1226(+)
MGNVHSAHGGIVMVWSLWNLDIGPRSFLDGSNCASAFANDQPHIIVRHLYLHMTLSLTQCRLKLRRLSTRIAAWTHAIKSNSPSTHTTTHTSTIPTFIQSCSFLHHLLNDTSAHTHTFRCSTRQGNNPLGGTRFHLMLFFNLHLAPTLPLHGSDGFPSLADNESDKSIGDAYFFFNSFLTECRSIMSSSVQSEDLRDWFGCVLIGTSGTSRGSATCTWETLELTILLRLGCFGIIQQWFN